MNLYLLMIIVFCLINIKVFIKGINEEYLSKDTTNCIKGIFVLIIFYSHLTTYFDVQYSKDFLMYNFRNFLGQLMVTPFLFYSGYGILESIKLKKNKYVNSLPINRILKTWIRFCIAIVLFRILGQIINENYSANQIFLSFFAWDTLGNSNWYIFSIIFMYLFTFISFKIFDNDYKKAIILHLILTVFYIMIMNLYKGEFWFNTILCYNLGLIYSLNKDRVNKVLFNNIKYILALITTIIFFIFFKQTITNFWHYEIYSILFVLIIILLSVKINLKSPILKWFGDHLFWIYILQRIPMIYFQNIGLSLHAYRYALVVFITTILLAYIFSLIFDKPINNICNKINSKIVKS